MGGAKILASWLDILPDGTHPNFNLVNGMLNCIATLQIDSNQLEESGLDNVVSYYESNDCKNPELQRLAKSIIDKWSRKIHKID